MPRRIARRRLNEEKAGFGEEWLTRRTEGSRRLQAYSHVSTAGALQTFLKPDSASRAFFMMPEGFYDERTAIGAAFACTVARDLLAASAFALAGLHSEQWRQDVRALEGQFDNIDGRFAELVARMEASNKGRRG